MGWMIRVSNLNRGWEFFSLTPCPDRLWGPASYPMGTRGSFSGGGKVAGA